MEFPPDNSAAVRTPPAPGGAPVPARTVADMIVIALHACFSRAGTVAAFAVPMFVLVTLPGFIANWLGYREMGQFFSSMMQGMSLEHFDPRSLVSLLQDGGGRIPAPGGSAVGSLLSFVGLAGAVVFGPLVLAALVLVVMGESLGIAVGARNAWHAVARRAGGLILTELVKGVLLFLIAMISVLIAVVVAILGGVLLDAIGGGPVAVLAVFLLIFAAGMAALGPIVFAYMLWLYTLPLVLFEKASISRALERSARMIRYRPAGQGVWDTHPMRLTGLLTLAGLVLLVAGLPAMAPPALWVARAIRSADGDPMVFFEMPASVMLTSTFLFAIPQVLLMPLFQGVIGLYYLDSRVRDEEHSGGGNPVREYLETLAGGALPGPALPQAAAPVNSTPEMPLYRPNPGIPRNWPDGR